MLCTALVLFNKKSRLSKNSYPVYTHAVSDPILKVKLFDLCLTSSIRANRWDALRDIFQNIIVKWDKKTILPYATYIHENNGKFTSLSEIIHVHIPALVTSYY